jgi:hypothetical protein
MEDWDMRGRKPSGPEYVDRLAGSVQAKERLKVVLATLAGSCRVQEACRQLGLSEPRFHQLRTQILAAALERLEPRPIGRPPAAAAVWTGEQAAALLEQLADKDVEWHAAQARAEVAAALGQSPPEAVPEKKTRQRPPPRRRRRRQSGKNPNT